MKNLAVIDENKDAVTKAYIDGLVVANPELDGTEPELTALLIGAILVLNKTNWEGKAGKQPG